MKQGLSIEENHEILSVKELNGLSKSLLESKLKNVWVQGEISNLAKPRSGHWYFTLKDADAQIRCACFKGINQRLGIELTEGQEVLALGNVSLYSPRGDYQLIVTGMQDSGEGKLRQAFEALKKKLSQEGLFATEVKKTLPSFATRIGVVTSPTGAALRDILSVLKRRSPFANVIIYPTQVQGESAHLQIIEAIEKANQHNEVDVLLISRGGGSLEDLWCFNHEALARAIYTSNIPTVSAVGHETDVTIADFVADLRAPTPSAAAELVSLDKATILYQIQQQQSRLVQCIRNILMQKSQQLDFLEKKLLSPQQQVERQKQTLKQIKLRLQQAVEKQLGFAKNRFTSNLRALNNMSPLATLERGYAIAKIDGKVIKNVEQVKVDDIISVQLHKGLIHCRATSKE